MTTLTAKPDGAIGSVPHCKTCGSSRVVRDAWACWNAEAGLWELEATFDHAHCQHCECETKLVWTTPDQPPRGRIRELNDAFRSDGRGHGSVMLTQGIQNLSEDVVRKIIDAIQAFDGFSEENDPWGEHDFGAIEIDGHKVFWKIDYYDPTLTMGSDNPGNEALTHRVLTVMLAEEY